MSVERMMDWKRAWMCVCVLGVLGACGGEEGANATPSAGEDQGVPREDQGMPGEVTDQGMTPADASMSAPDLGAPDLGAADLDTRDSGASEDQGMPLDMAAVEDQGGDMAPPGMANGCGKEPGANDRKWSLQHGGKNREFYVHYPASYDPNVPHPVVFDFHGRTMNARSEQAMTGMVGAGDRKGFIVVHPEGLQGTWNAGSYCCGYASSAGIDDVGFTREMIAAVSESLCVDDKAVFVTGMSNGSYLAHKIGCELSEQVAAIAPVSGPLVSPCAPTRPVGVWHFHGTSDSIVPYEGYDTTTGSDSVDHAIETWRMRDQCTGQGEVFFQQDDVTCTAWRGCAQGREVRLCTIAGGGHTWPGGNNLPFLGRTTTTISASELMLDFFLAQRRP